MLTKKQVQSIKLIVEGYKTHEVAEIVGIHRATLWRWCQRDEYQCALHRYSKAWINAWRRSQEEKVEMEIKELDALLDSDDARIANIAANQILEWLGFTQRFSATV